jgi:cell division protein FtsW
MFLNRSDELKKQAKIFCLSSFVLVMFGFVFIYSSSSAFAMAKHGSAIFFLKKHLFQAVFSFLALLVCAIIPAKLFKIHAEKILLIAIVGLAISFIPGVGFLVNGSRRWFSVFGVSFQPGEAIAPALIIYVASFLSIARNNISGNNIAGSKIYENKNVFISKSGAKLFFFTGLSFLILLAQPDFGSVMTLFSALFILFSTVLLSLRQMASIVAMAIPAVVALILIAPYRVRRIVVFLNPWQDPKGKGFQIIQSLIAIGSGSLWGVGIGQSQQKFFYLPMQHTDFIFSVIAEETGFVGVLIVVVTFAVFFYSGFKIALLLSDEFSSYAALGLTSLLAVRTVINMMVTSAMAPTKGIGLPFISYGGTALLAALCSVGLIISFVRSEA